MTELVVSEASKFSAEVVDYLLWLCALEGGSTSRALRRAEGEGRFKELPSRQALDKWKRGTYRNRYSELVTLRRERFDDEQATSAQIIARQIAHAEEAAVKQTMAGLSGANGVEASNILRNLTQSKGINLDLARKIHERPLAERQADSMEEIAGALNRLAGSGAVTIETGEEIRDAEVVEDDQLDSGSSP